jgi:hypothetical protein
LLDYSLLPYPCFHIDVTFEMRKFLSGICLFNDTTLNVRHHFILNGKRGEECDIAERQRERESVCERDSAWQREEVASVVKWSIEENVMGEIRVGLKG